MITVTVKKMLGFFDYWHINIRVLFNASTIFVKEYYRYYLPWSWKDENIYAFPKGISPKVNVRAPLAFVHTDYDVSVLGTSGDVMVGKLANLHE